MTDTANPAPAGAGDAPVANSDPTSILDRAWEGDPGMPEDATAEAVADEPDQGKEEPQTEETSTEPEPEGEGEEEIAEAGEDEEPADDAAEAEPKKADDEGETGSRVHRLRDGTEATLADLKRGFDEARQFRAALPKIQQERQQLLQERAQSQAQQQQLQPILATVAQVLQSQVPPMPDQALLKSDPIAFFEQKYEHEAAVNRLHQVNQARAQQEEEGRRQTAQNLQTARQQAIATFVAKRPELREPEKSKAFGADLKAVAQHVGYTDAEIGDILDHRLYEVSRLAAIGLRAEQAEKKASQTKVQQKAVAAQKVAKAPPVSAPAARQSAATRAGQVARGDLERLRKTGSVQDAEAFLSKFV